MTWGASHVTMRFGQVVALDDVSLDAPAGAVTGVVGGDGAGKTTLLRILAGTLAATGGEVRRPPARRLGYLSPGSGTYPDLSIDENLEFAATTYGLTLREARRQAAPYLERTGLAEFRQRLAGQLSGGMRQKLGVIRAMLHRPDLLVLDEPTTGIDPVSRVDLWWLIGRAAAEAAAVVFATTYLDEAERASHLLVLEAGQPLAEGTPDEIVAAAPGTIQARTRRPADDEMGRAWRRRARWRVWEPPRATAGPAVDANAARAEAAAGEWALPDSEGDQAELVALDLQDAVTVLALQRELAAAGNGRKPS